MSFVKKDKDKCMELVELVNSVESINELLALCKTMDCFLPIKYRMLVDMGEIDNGIGGIL